MQDVTTLGWLLTLDHEGFNMITPQTGTDVL